MGFRRGTLEDLEGLIVYMYDLTFFKGKRILLTGHTGFKGAWLSRILMLAGADAAGYSLAPLEEPSLFSLLA